MLLERHPSAAGPSLWLGGLKPRYHRLTLNRFTFAVVGIALALAGLGVASGAASGSVASGARGPTGNPGVLGLVLSGAGATLVPPTGPASYPYTPDCQSLVDAAFVGKCVVATSALGTVAGIVEEETATRENPSRPHTAGASGVQERDLVWHRKGDRWVLALRRVLPAHAGLPTLLWADDVARSGNVDLVFVTPTDRAGFGNELDVVSGSGRVILYRYLGQGFAEVPTAGGVVTYVPGWTEENGPFSDYDEVLIGYSVGRWQVFSEQYVPVPAALAQHRGAFWDSLAIPAS